VRRVRCTPARPRRRSGPSGSRTSHASSQVFRCHGHRRLARVDTLTSNQWEAPMRQARRMSLVRPSAIRELLRHGADPELISFGGGYPDPALFPMADLNEIFAKLLTSSPASLQYCPSNGLPELRAQVAARLTRDGLACDGDDVLIIQGGQQGLD